MAHTPCADSSRSSLVFIATRARPRKRQYVRWGVKLKAIKQKIPDVMGVMVMVNGAQLWSRFNGGVIGSGGINEAAKKLGS